MDFVAFILDHADDDTSRLLLSRGKYPGIDIDLAVNTIESRRKLRTKVPQWYAVPSLRLPSALSAEQCSSAATARNKASLALRVFHEFSDDALSPRIADLTGGFGVDSWAFSEVASEVLYNEMLQPLADAAEWNFKELGINNIRVSSRRIAPASVSDGTDSFCTRDILGDFRPDVIFMDPARRSSAGRKVFLLEDCSPDVLSLQDELLAECRLLMLKLSPMADITMLLRRLSHVREVHVVSAGGECKELLVVIDAEFSGEPSIVAVELSGGAFSFRPSDEAAAIPGIPVELPAPGDILFEPGKSLSKAGAFSLVSSRSGLPQMAPSTHLYLSSGAVPEELNGLGKQFIVKEIWPLNKRTLKDVGDRFPRADVSARNIPMSSDELRKRLSPSRKSPQEPAVHIFGVRIAVSGAESGNYLLVTEPA